MAKPAITIDVEDRESITVNLGGMSLEVWPLKQSLYADYMKRVPALNALLPKNGKPIDGKALMDKATKDEAAAMALVWSFLASSLDSTDDYVALRRRIYGTPKEGHEKDLESCEHIPPDSIEVGPPVSEPLEMKHIVKLMISLIEHFNPGGTTEGSGE